MWGLVPLCSHPTSQCSRLMERAQNQVPGFWPWYCYSRLCALGKCLCLSGHSFFFLKMEVTSLSGERLMRQTVRNVWERLMQWLEGGSKSSLTRPHPPATGPSSPSAHTPVPFELSYCLVNRSALVFPSCSVLFCAYAAGFSMVGR